MPRVEREVPEQKQGTSCNCSSKHLMHGSSFPTQHSTSVRSTRIGNNVFKKHQFPYGKENSPLSHIKYAHAIHSSMFTDWGNHIPTFLLACCLFLLEPSLNLKLWPFLQDFWTSSKQATAPQCSKLNTHVTAGHTL